MYYMLIDRFLECWNANSPPPTFKLKQADQEFLHKPHLLFQRDFMNRSLQLIYNTVHTGDTPGGGFSYSIQ